MPEAKQKVGFVLLGGIHHILHLIPPAAEMANHPSLKPIIFTRTQEEAVYCQDIIQKLGAAKLQIQILKAPKLSTKISDKLAPIFWNIGKLQKMDALVVAERTSTILKKLPFSLPSMIHIPHGAGDRAKSYDKRIRLFDHVIVAGPKDKNRMVDLDLVTEESCSVSGYVKAAALKRIYPNRDPLFSDDKPVVLYNPHFDKKLSSWWKFGPKILESFSKQSEFNFIFAPHIRLFSNAPNQTRSELEAFGRADNILIDLGSESSTDMTYTCAADVYIGDVSSQVYEFLISLKPCLFLAYKEFTWRNNPDYAHWQYGPVESHTSDILQSVKSSIDTHPAFKSTQIAGRDQALGDPKQDALANCVAHISNFLKKLNHNT